MMNVEDEYFRAIENRDTAIMMRDKRIEEQDQRIEEQGKQLEEQGKQLEAKDKTIEDQHLAIQSMVKLLKQSGMDPVQIATMTGLSWEVIQQIE